MKVLNVGGGAGRGLPTNYDGWEQDLLDIDPEVKPDICLDARGMTTLPADTYNAVFCSHNLEHFYQYEVPLILGGFFHVLKAGGIVEVQVPDVLALMRDLLSRNHDLNDVWYRAGTEAMMPITFHDVLYGWSGKLKEGNHWYAHKCGFSPLTLAAAMTDAGFTDIGLAVDKFNIFAKGNKPCQP